MTWVRIDDGFYQHPKVVAAGPLAMAMQVAALCYCNRNLTDGFVPWAVAQNLLSWEFMGATESERGRPVFKIGLTCGMAGDDVTCQSVIQVLVGYGLWDEADGGFVVHDYLDYQPSKAEILALRETKSRAGKASARSKRKHSAGQGHEQSVEHPVNTVFNKTATQGSGSGKGNSGDPEGPRAREDLIEDEGRVSLPGIIAREWVQVLKEHGGSAVPDLAGAGICEEHLRHLSDADRLTVLRGYRDDPDPWLDERGHALRWLTADRANRYLMPRVRKPPPKTLTSWGPCDIGTPPEGANG